MREDKTLDELAQQFDVHANQITDWRRQLLERAGEVFSGAVAAPAGLAHFLNFCNSARPHSSLDGKTPDQVYFSSNNKEDSPLAKAAA